MRLADKIALVTGAAAGFGAGIARRYAAEGAKVVCADINLAGAEAIARELGGVAVGGDVSRGEDVAAMVARAVDAFGGLDILVNNAGTTHRNQPMLDVTEAEFDKIYAVNVKSIYWTTQHAVPLLRRQGRGGAIINIASTAGIRPRGGLTWYNGTKGAVNIITLSMAQELGKDRIRVNAICPVMGETALLEAFMGMPDTPENRAKFLGTIPLGRMSTGEDVANAALFLAEDSSNFLTGVLLPVDGGRTA